MRRWWRRRAWPARLMFAIALALALLLALSWAADARAPEQAVDPRAPRAVWLTHRWVGEPPDRAALDALAARLEAAGATDVYAHVGPLDADGRVAADLAPHAAAFADALHERLPDLRVQAWLGQVEAGGGGKLDLGDPAVRRGTVRTAERFMREGFDGIHYDIEPIWNGDRDFLALLEETAAMLRRRDGVLSVAGEELPVFPGAERVIRAVIPRYHPWTVAYHRAVARHADQIAVMTYDSAMPLGQFYRRFVARNARVLGRSLPHGTQLLIGVPSYEEWNVGHWPAENVPNALAGLRRGLARLEPSDRQDVGWALYADWHTDDREWERLR